MTPSPESDEALVARLREVIDDLERNGFQPKAYLTFDEWCALEDRLTQYQGRLAEAEAALNEAQVGLEFAGADRDIPVGEFVPTPTLALRAVKAYFAPHPQERP